jgi:hypothetical protein
MPIGVPVRPIGTISVGQLLAEVPTWISVMPAATLMP